uniref:RING-type domain-containing protein n=1 Tax=Parascaris univalens TaxID=6257 RepID=A0A915A0M8_PARUN
MLRLYQLQATVMPTSIVSLRLWQCPPLIIRFDSHFFKVFSVACHIHLHFFPYFNCFSNFRDNQRKVAHLVFPRLPFPSLDVRIIHL